MARKYVTQVVYNNGEFDHSIRILNDYPMQRGDVLRWLKENRNVSEEDIVRLEYEDAGTHDGSETDYSTPVPRE